MFKKKQEKIITFKCQKNQISDFNDGIGDFDLTELKIFTYHNQNIRIIIQDYGVIEKGELQTIQ